MRRGWWVVGVCCVVACGSKSREPGATHDTAPPGTAGAVERPSSCIERGTGPESTVSGNGGRTNDGTAYGGAAAEAGANDDAQAGQAGAANCIAGSVRCQSLREHCDAAGNWVKESFVCATDINASSMQPLACAVKSDGQMTCFGSATDELAGPLLSNTPQRNWAKIILADDPAVLSDHQLCGIDVDESGVCWNKQGTDRPLPLRLTQIAPGEDGLCVVWHGGASECEQDLGLYNATLTGAGEFKDLLVRSDFLFGLNVDGTVSVPYPQFSLPAGVYTQISAGNAELCGLRSDHTLACAPNAVPAALASQHFSQVAVEYWGSMCAIRDDQTLVCDALGQDSAFTPPAGEFTRLVAPLESMCGIRTDGTIACFGNNAPVPTRAW